MATVLVVDDNATVLDMAVKVLEQAGYGVLRASNGLEALQVFQSYATRIDLVLTDVEMPEMDGVELVARIRATHPSAKVVLMSGAPPPALEDMPGVLLRKPFQPDKLVEVVREAVAGGA